MATAKFNIRAGTLVSLPLGLFSEVHYADFHKRSETSYPDVSITAADLPLSILVKRDGSEVSLASIISGFTTGTELVNESTNTQTLGDGRATGAVVTPSRFKGDDLRYDWYKEINFANITEPNVRVEHTGGTIPAGLTVSPDLLSGGYVIFSGNIDDDLFDIDMYEYETLYDAWYLKQQTTFEDVKYIDNLIDKNVLENPPSTFSAGDTITNVDEGSMEIRTINNVYTYTGLYDEDELTKTAIDVDTYVSVLNNYTGDYVKIYEPFNVLQQQKFDTYGEALTLQSSWRGYISNAERTIFAEYTDVRHGNTSMDVFEKTYIFVLTLINDDTSTVLDQKTFSMVVQASPEALRDNYMEGKGMRVAQNKHFHRYTQDVYDLLR